MYACLIACNYVYVSVLLVFFLCAIYDVIFLDSWFYSYDQPIVFIYIYIYIYIYTHIMFTFNYFTH